jgi:hypothetical protein
VNITRADLLSVTFDPLERLSEFCKPYDYRRTRALFDINESAYLPYEVHRRIVSNDHCRSFDVLNSIDIVRQCSTRYRHVYYSLVVLVDVAAVRVNADETRQIVVRIHFSIVRRFLK